MKGAFFEEFVNALDDLVFIKDREHRWVFLNDACCKFWGFSRKKLIGKSDFDIFPKEEAEVYWAKDQEVFRTKKPVLNIENQTVGDRQYIIATKKSLYRDEETGEEFIVGTIRDITEEERARAAVKESEEQFRYLADFSPNMIFIHQKERVVYVNKKCEESLGYSLEEFYSPDFDLASIIAPEFQESVQEAFRRHMRGEEVPAYDYALITKGGIRIDAIITTKLITYHGDRAIFGVVTDIGAHKKIEEELRKSEERYRALFDNSIDAIYILDRMGKILEANRVACERLGYGREDLLKMKLGDLKDAEGPVEKQNKKGRAESKKPYAYEAVHIARDGRKIPVEISTRTVEFEGEPAVLAVSRDITERKEAERALKEKEEQLLHAQKMEAIGRLAGGIAHDFNNLLTAVLGYAELIMMDRESAEKQRNYAKEIRDAAKRGALLTRQLLLFSKRQVPIPKRLDVDALIKNLENMMRRIIGENIIVSVKHNSHGTRIMADLAQIEQILVNLLVNAKDAMPEGGAIEIETGVEYLENRRCHFGQEVETGEYVFIEVRDTGQGIPKEMSKLVFEPFFTTKELGKGTGLGLATVYGIVNQNRGYLFMESALGKGTKIRVDFPVFKG
jgi:two-component system cell cycle sensor histidine kinase/response regulator CckA